MSHGFKQAHSRSRTALRTTCDHRLITWCDHRLLHWIPLLLLAVFLTHCTSQETRPVDRIPVYGNEAAAEANRQGIEPLVADYESYYKEYSDLIRPVLSPEQALETFQLEEGFRIELVAHEPDIVDPVAMDIDRDGRLWVAEMISYMTVYDMSDEETSLRERVPQGRIVVLEDTNGDGMMDSSRVFMDELVLPRAIKVLDDGVLIAEPPHLWFISDSDGDGIGDEKILVDDRYGDPLTGNVEHLPNGLMWGMDNWLHSAHTGVESLRRIEGEWVSRPFERLGQWGMTQDDWGRLYSTHNSRSLLTHLVPCFYSHRHPEFDLEEGLDVNIAESETMWPAHATGVNRGYREGMLREDGTLARSTAVSSGVIYRGDQFGDEYRGDAFVPEPAGNLIKRLVSFTDDPAAIDATARFAYREREFLTSTDERFRPVNIYNAPDGSLYVIDMYRGIFQHARFLTDYLRDYAVERDLHEPTGPGTLGRIYRIVRDDRPIHYETPKLGAMKPTELVTYLEHENGLHRDHAQQLLVQRSPGSVAGTLESLVTDRDKPFYTRLQALWTLEGYTRGVYDAESLESVALKALDDTHPRIRAAALKILEPSLRSGSDRVLERLAVLAEQEQAPYVQIQLLASLGESPEIGALRLMTTILERNGDDQRFHEMALTGIHGREGAFANLLQAEHGWTIEEDGIRGELMAALDAVTPDEGQIHTVSEELDEETQRILATGGRVYATCGACHGGRGEGFDGVAPPLDGSEWVTGDPEVSVRILLHGFHNDERSAVWGVMHSNGFMSDEEIAT